MKKILVTGCDGFIASYICEELLNNDYEVFGIDNHSKYKYPYTDHHSRKNFSFILLDILDSLMLKNIMNRFQPDVVIHTAAIIGGIRMFHERQYDIIAENAKMDAGILNASIEAKVKRFIGLSSSMVYENAIDFPSSERDLSIIPPPSSTYGFSKLALEYMIKGAWEQYNLPYTIIRPFNAIGLRENDFMEGKNSHVLPDLISKVLKGQDPLHIFGDGNQIRCYTSAKDIARGIRLAVESKYAINEDFNISTSIATSVLVLAEKIWKKINKDKPFYYVSDEPYKYDVKVRVPNINKAKSLLGFQAEISLEQTIDELIEYMRNK